VFDPGYWYITSQEGQFGGWDTREVRVGHATKYLLRRQQRLPEPIRNPALWMSFGIIFGAMVMAR